MEIIINDDFDLKKIETSGQCFRPREIEPGLFCFIYRENILFIKELSDSRYDISCDTYTWKNIWKKYFDLDTDYRSIRASIPEGDGFMKEASNKGTGIRILNQDPFEMLISFIISQRKSIPAIRKSVEKICSIYGEPIDTDYGTLHLFPNPTDIIKKGPEGLLECSLGYRLSYIEKAVYECADKTIDLDGMKKLNDDELLGELMKIYGVGKKVASCVALFAYGRGGIAPVDTWISKVIENYYGGIDPFPGYGQNSGICQQYAFYEAIH